MQGSFENVKGSFDVRTPSCCSALQGVAVRCRVVQGSYERVKGSFDVRTPSPFHVNIRHDVCTTYRALKNMLRALSNMLRALLKMFRALLMCAQQCVECVDVRFSDVPTPSIFSSDLLVCAHRHLFTKEPLSHRSPLQKSPNHISVLF